MTRRLLTVLALSLGVLVLAACSFAPQSAATPTLPPSETPPPTATLEPTATATPLPTETPVPSSTPNRVATTSAKSTATAEAFFTKKVKPAFEEAGLDVVDGMMIWTGKTPIPLAVVSFSSYRPEIIVDDSVANFVLYTRVEWDTTSGLAGCGVIFRAEPDLAQGAKYALNLMRLQNAPAWNIEYQKYARTQERLISSEAMFQNRLNDGPSSTNSILMFVQGEKITTYLNGEKMQEVTHRKLKEGVIGFIAWQESGTTFCTFRDGWVMQLP